MVRFDGYVFLGIRLLNDFEINIWELLLWSYLSAIMVMNNIMYGKKDNNYN